ncbi:MAG: hypothetical protein AAFN08_11430 [Cyanobacteria bacterium J06559_3]
MLYQLERQAQKCGLRFRGYISGPSVGWHPQEMTAAVNSYVGTNVTGNIGDRNIRPKDSHSGSLRSDTVALQPRLQNHHFEIIRHLSR